MRGDWEFALTGTVPIAEAVLKGGVVGLSTGFMPTAPSINPLVSTGSRLLHHMVLLPAQQVSLQPPDQGGKHHADQH
jgi:hypothetical protein